MRGGAAPTPAASASVTACVVAASEPVFRRAWAFAADIFFCRACARATRDSASARNLALMASAEESSTPPSVALASAACSGGGWAVESGCGCGCGVNDPVVGVAGDGASASRSAFAIGRRGRALFSPGPDGSGDWPWLVGFSKRLERSRMLGDTDLAGAPPPDDDGAPAAAAEGAAAGIIDLRGRVGWAALRSPACGLWM